ncbi:hypothetical protein [Novipirellula artificiosorum]|uniref:hypothetical protein n=1 Tax=Novipirellula artificiosorum TaxID=2528016 RepID=UPI0018CED028|nr:hypothetical protein [Novipirellula artificiosorum]
MFAKNAGFILLTPRRDPTCHSGDFLHVDGISSSRLKWDDPQTQEAIGFDVGC